MRDPTKLRVLGEARTLAVATYGATARFPRDERFGLTAQMRRAAVSIGSNVIEGCHRSGNRALIVFLHNALGSAAELQFQIELAVCLKYGQRSDLMALHEQATRCKKMLSKLITTLRSRGN